MQYNAIIFFDAWPIMKVCKPNEMMDKLSSIYKENDLHYWRIGMTEQMFKDMHSNVFHNAPIMYVLRMIDDAFGVDRRGNLLFVNEYEVKQAFVNFINTNTSITSKRYVKNLLTAAHSAFFNIGRERKYEKGKLSTYPEIVSGKPLMNNGNPLTDSTKRSVLDEFKKLENQRQSRYMVQ
jgi:hypothetical protein